MRLQSSDKFFVFFVSWDLIKINIVNNNSGYSSDFQLYQITSDNVLSNMFGDDVPQHHAHHLDAVLVGQDDPVLGGSS